MLKDTRRRSGELSAQDKKSVQAIREKMAAISEEISKYDILSGQINEAKAAFENFESAKTADSDSDYLNSTSEMFQAFEVTFIDENFEIYFQANLIQSKLKYESGFIVDNDNNTFEVMTDLPEEFWEGLNNG